MKTVLVMAVWLLAALLSVPAGFAQQQNDAKEKKEKKVITEDDIATAPAEENAETAAKTGPDASPPAPETPEEPLTPEAELAAAQKEYDTAARAEQSLKSKLQALQDKAATEPSEFRRTMYQEAVVNQQVTLEEFKAQQEAAQKKIEAAQAKVDAEKQGGKKPK